MSDNTSQQPDIGKASLFRALWKAAGDSYDRLGFVLILSMLWSTTFVLPLVVVRLLSLPRTPYTAIGGAISIALGAVVFGAVFQTAHTVVYKNLPSISDLWDGVRYFWKGSLALAAINIIVIGVILNSIAFFLGIFGPIQPGVASYIASGISILALVFWLMSALYHFPVLVAARSLGQRGGAFAAVKKSLLLAMHNPGFTIGLFVVILGFSILCAVTRIGMFLLYAGVVSIALTHAVRELYARYGIIQRDLEPVDDTRWRVE